MSGKKNLKGGKISKLVGLLGIVHDKWHIWVYFLAIALPSKWGEVGFKFIHLIEKYSAALDFFIGKNHSKISFKSKTPFCRFNFPAGRGSNISMAQGTYPGKPQHSQSH